MIVADANVIVYHLIQGDKTDWAHRVCERDAEWGVPAIWRHEFANALTVNVRVGGLALDAALAVYVEADALFSDRELLHKFPEIAFSMARFIGLSDPGVARESPARYGLSRKRDGRRPRRPSGS